MDDAGLLTRLKKGDDKAFQYLYDQFRKEFTDWVNQKYPVMRREADDIFQQSIVELYTNLVEAKLVSLTSTLKTYLFAIGKNITRARHRRKIKEQETLSKIPMGEAAHNQENAQRDEQIDLLKKGMLKLGDPCRKLLELFYYQKLTMQEICHEMQYKNPDTAKSKKYKCVQRLMKLVDELS